MFVDYQYQSWDHTEKCFHCHATIKPKDPHELFLSDEGPGDVTEYWICMACVRNKKLEKLLDETISK